MQIPLKTARKYAEQIVAEIAPYCLQVEIAGSVRRQSAVVNDIDLVVMPKDWEGLKARCLRHCNPITRGDAVFSFETKSQVQVDIFTARPEREELFQVIPSTWGSVLLCRTGSKAHNVYLCQLAVSKGWKWCTSVGLFNGKGELLASETEEDIFKALGLGYIKPERRQRGEERGVGSEVNWEIPNAPLTGGQPPKGGSSC